VSFAEVTVSRSYEQIVQQIQDSILRGEFSHGQKLPAERELGRAFGVSRATVRDAMRVLGALGLIESRQGSGIYVRHDPVPVVSRALTLSVTPDEQLVEHLFTFREGLETQAVQLAVKHCSADQLAAICQAAANTQVAAARGDGDPEAFGVADRAFHAAIREAAGNPYLSVVLGAAREMQRDVVALIVQQPGSLAVAAEQHRRIAAAIAARDPAEAAAAMREHVRYTAGVVRAVLDTGPLARAD
jgi:GntR family transcriptional repressor for pyruvate dehydrogenase complex